jgi:hypothetical protein
VVLCRVPFDRTDGDDARASQLAAATIASITNNAIAVSTMITTKGRRKKAPATPLQCNADTERPGPSQSGRQFGPLRSAFAGRTLNHSCADNLALERVTVLDTLVDYRGAVGLPRYLAIHGALI